MHPSTIVEKKSQATKNIFNLFLYCPIGVIVASQSLLLFQAWHEAKYALCVSVDLQPYIPCPVHGSVSCLYTYIYIAKMFMLCLLGEDEEGGARSCGEAEWKKESGHLQFILFRLQSKPQ